MAFVKRFIGAAAALSIAAAIPMPDSALGEVAVSAPNGIPMSDTPSPALETAGGQVKVASAPQVTQAPSYGGYGQYPSDPHTSSTYNGYEPSYGSGSSNWGGSGYDSCVQKCVASYGAPPYEYKPTGTSDTYGYGGGATHTVIVAPTQGVLRYVPFALNASVGDTIKFVWGANNHTVTKGSALLPCNKSSDGLFASGVHDKGFEFTQIVNTTDPTYYYCATPGHCQKGMFGIINPHTDFGAATSVDVIASDLASKDSNAAALWSSTNKATEGNDRASKWGGGIDSKDMPEWSKGYLVENTMYIRSFLAMNKDVLKSDGSIDLSNAANTPLIFPQDLSVALNSGSTPATSKSVESTASSPAATPSASSAGAAGSQIYNGASSLASSKILMGLMAIVATFFAL